MRILKLFAWMMFTFGLSAQTKQATRPVTLDSLFRLLDQRSTALKLSASSVDLANQQVAVARNSQLPSIDIGLSATYLGDATLTDRNFSSIQRAAMPHVGNNFSLEASYLIFSGGAVSKNIVHAQLDAQVAELSHRKQISDMRLLVAGYYLDLYKLRNQDIVFRKNIEQTQVLIREVEARQQEGMALPNDITRYELLLQNLKLSQLEVRNNIQILHSRLLITLGLPSGTVIRTDSVAPCVQITPSDSIELIKIAESNKPEWQAAKVNTKIARNKVNLISSSYYPQVALVAADKLDGPITFEIPPIDKNINYWYVGLGIKYNLASLYKTPKEIKTAKSAVKLSEYALQLEKEHTQTAVFAAQTSYAESFEKLHTYEKSFQLASENYRIVSNRYHNGLVLITEMLDAANMKLNAELQVVNANLSIVYNHLLLLRELGTL